MEFVEFERIFVIFSFISFVFLQGNYDAYVQTRVELETNQMKRYQWEQEQVAKTKGFIARFGSGSRASQAQSREKTLAKMIESGLTERIVHEKVRSDFFFFFFCCSNHEQNKSH